MNHGERRLRKYTTIGMYISNRTLKGRVKTLSQFTYWLIHHGNEVRAKIVIIVYSFVNHTYIMAYNCMHACHRLNFYDRKILLKLTPENYCVKGRRKTKFYVTATDLRRQAALKTCKISQLSTSKPLYFKIFLNLSLLNFAITEDVFQKRTYSIPT